MSSKIPDHVVMLMGQLAGQQCAVQALVAVLFHERPELRPALIKARDASEHLINALATTFQGQPTAEFVGIAADIAEQIWSPIKEGGQPKSGI